MRLPAKTKEHGVLGRWVSVYTISVLAHTLVFLLTWTIANGTTTATSQSSHMTLELTTPLLESALDVPLGPPGDGEGREIAATSIDGARHGFSDLLNSPSISGAGRG